MNPLVAPRTLLRLEGTAVFSLCLGLYASTGTSWWLFAGAFLAPDLAMAAYGAGPTIGAACYNAAHLYALPILLAGSSLFTSGPPLTPLALIWAAHIGFDRMLGYGLKHPSGFQDTHLGSIGGSSMPSP